MLAGLQRSVSGEEDREGFKLAESIVSRYRSATSGSALY
jgi:hypothetical protein